MDAIHHLRLVGGPYDGDTGDLDRLPPYLWAYPCDCNPGCYGINGIHWGWDDHHDPSRPASEEYRYSYADDRAHVYRWAALKARSGGSVRESVHV